MLRRIFTIVPIVLLLGLALLLFFINLVGANNTSVLGDFYWSKVSGNGLPAPNGFQTVRWTSYNICNELGGRNSGCTSTKAAYPYSPKDNFGTSDGIPKTFVKDRNTYYYLTRFAYAFYLVGLVFALFALIPVIFSCFTSGFITGAFSLAVSGLALLFTAAATAFITAAHVKGRNAFRNAGFLAGLGVKMFGIAWAATAALLLAFLWMVCVSSVAGSRRMQRRNTEKQSSDYSHKSYPSDLSYQPEERVEGPERRSRGVPFFRTTPAETRAV